MNNIVNQILQIMSSSTNPNLIVQDMLRRNPQAQALFNQMQQNNMSPKEFTMQYAKQNNIDIQSILNALRQSGMKF